MPILDDERRHQRRFANSISSSASRPVCMLGCVSGKGGGERSANCAIAQQSLNKQRRCNQSLDLASSVQLLGFCSLAPLANRNASCSTLAMRRSDRSQDLLLAPPDRGRSAMAPLSVHGCLGLMDAVWKLPRVLDRIVVATVTAMRQTMRLIRQAACAVWSIVFDESALIFKGTIDHQQLSHPALHPQQRSATANAVFDEWASQALYRKRSVECVPFQPTACLRYCGDLRCDAMLWLASQARHSVMAFYPMRACVPSIQSNAQWSACCQPLRSVRAERKFLMARMISTTKVSA